MPRISALALEDIPELRHLFDAGKELMGFYPNDGLIMARHPAMLKAFLGLVQSILAAGKIDPILKRMIGIISSSTAGCQYCTAHAAHQAHERGEGEEKLNAVWEYKRSELFTAAEKSALSFAVKAAQIPNAVTDEDFDTLKIHFTEDEIVEILGVISLYGFLNRWNASLATPLEQAPWLFAQNHLNAKHWNGDNHQPKT